MTTRLPLALLLGVMIGIGKQVRGEPGCVARRALWRWSVPVQTVALACLIVGLPCLKVAPVASPSNGLRARVGQESRGGAGIVGSRLVRGNDSRPQSGQMKGGGGETQSLASGTSAQCNVADSRRGRVSTPRPYPLGSLRLRLVVRGHDNCFRGQRLVKLTAICPQSGQMKGGGNGRLERRTPVLRIRTATERDAVVLLRVKVTAFCPCPRCCGRYSRPWRNLPSRGIATRLYRPGTRLVLTWPDGSRSSHVVISHGPNHLDMAMPRMAGERGFGKAHERARRFGSKRVKVEVK